MVPQTTRHFIFASKVAACAQAEELASNRVDSLVWIDPECLIVNPPSLFKLGPGLDAAVRPVHIKSIGLLKDEPLNGYWERIYHLTDRRDPGMLVETFVDRQQIRAYFNSHAFAINPTLGLLREWAG